MFETARTFALQRIEVADSRAAAMSYLNAALLHHTAAQIVREEAPTVTHLLRAAPDLPSIAQWIESSAEMGDWGDSQEGRKSFQDCVASWPASFDFLLFQNGLLRPIHGELFERLSAECGLTGTSWLSLASTHSLHSEWDTIASSAERFCRAVGWDVLVRNLGALRWDDDRDSRIKWGRESVEYTFRYWLESALFLLEPILIDVRIPPPHQSQIDEAFLTAGNPPLAWDSSALDDARALLEEAHDEQMAARIDLVELEVRAYLELINQPGDPTGLLVAFESGSLQSPDDTHTWSAPLRILHGRATLFEFVDFTPSTPTGDDSRWPNPVGIREALFRLPLGKLPSLDKIEIDGIAQTSIVLDSGYMDDFRLVNFRSPSHGRDTQLRGPNAETLSWTNATSLEDLGELIVDWLDGQSETYPLYAGPPDPETAELRELLVMMNRSGLVTLMSQPGVEEPGWLQRALVEGIGHPEAICALRDAAEQVGAHVMATGSGPDVNNRVVVTLDDGVEYTWCGTPVLEELRLLTSNSTPQLRKAVFDANRFIVIDMEWGRKEVIHQAVREWAKAPRCYQSGCKHLLPTDI